MEPRQAKASLKVLAFHILCDDSVFCTHSRLEMYDALKYAIGLIEMEEIKNETNAKL